MKTTAKTVNGVRVLEVEGRFDAHTSKPVQAWLTDDSPYANAVVNLSGVNFIDSTALAVLVQGMKRCREKGGDLHLCNMQQATRIIFELTRFDKAFDIFADEQAAVMGFA
jgi:anti-sigma B factor antagonist